ERPQQGERTAVVEPQLAVLSRCGEAVELLDIKGGLRMPQSANGVNDSEVVDDLDRIVAEGGYEQISAPLVVAEVIDSPQRARKNGPGSQDERRKRRCAIRGRLRRPHTHRPRDIGDR